ncbi:MAG: hypothetical protein R2830_11060 [Saprospiraceae bacterium]
MQRIFSINMKLPGLNTTAALLLLCCFQNSACFAQPVLDAAAFRTMSGAERFQLVQGLPFGEMDSAALTKVFAPLIAIASEKKDYRALFALKYHAFQSRRALRLTSAEIFALLSDMGEIAANLGSAVEKTVAHHYLIFENYDQKKIPHEQLYSGILQEFEQMEAIGFDKFRDYNIARMLFHLGRFMYQLEDMEKALQYLLVAERYIQPSGTGWQTYIYVLNHIQSIYQQQKDYEKGIGYAKKILHFAQAFKTVSPEDRMSVRSWEGIASIDIASMLVGQQQFAEGERYASKGYALVRAPDLTDDVQLQTEYDMLHVLIATKLELGKLGEASSLLQRMDDIYKVAGKHEYFYFKNAHFFEAYARYFEMKGDYAAAVRYANLAKPLQDSLGRRNDARKLEKIKQRLEAEKYSEKLLLVESEKQLQEWLRNAALLLLLLVGLLAFVNFRRLRHKRRIALLELDAAKKDLATFTQHLREKSELAENLRLEMEKLSRSGERSDYLEQLTHSTILTDEDWTQFRGIFEKVHPDFIAEQKTLHPGLTQAELRYLVLEKLQLSTHEMANMLGVSDGTIRQTRMRLKRKITA